MTTIREPRLGVDFGRVIHGGAGPDGRQDTVFLDGDLDQALESPATEGAFEVLPLLTRRFEGRVWIISKCGPAVERKTRLWLDRHAFWERTGVPAGHLRFCRRRADKAVHCADLGITHMIDDRLDVHAAIREVVPNRYLFGPQGRPPPGWVTPTLTWADVATAVTADLASPGHDEDAAARAGRGVC
ncbi:MAG TPA: hypothetical protein VHJ17_22110 [Thermomonospora sp.]|nr:hypothetical protein [Thermomonospora sp.]